MKRKFSFADQSGQSLLEIVIGLGIGAVLIGTAAFVLAAVLKANSGIQRSQMAGALSQELMDQVRAFGNADWQNLYSLSKGSDNTYFLNASGSTFSAFSGEDGVISNDIRSGLVGYWKFNEGSGASTEDASGHGLQGALSVGGSGTQTTTAQAWANGASGKVGQAIHFDGADDYVSGDDAGFPSGSSDRSVVMWVNPDALASGWRAFFFYGTESTGQGILFSTDDANPTKLILGRHGLNSSASLIALTTGSWQHIGFTVSGTNVVTFYINGAFAGSSTLSGINTALSSFKIADGWNASDKFNGSIDEVRVYNRALSADEIYRLYNSSAYLRSFYVENVCRSTDASSTISGTAPCADGTSDDPLAQKVTISTSWTVAGNTNAVTLQDYLTRWQNAIFWQTDWSGGDGDGDVYTTPGTTFASSSNIDITTSGSIRIIGL